MFDDEENFAALTDAILPVLTPVKRHDRLLAIPEDKQIRILSRFPQKVLELLWKILPDNSRDWPYNAADVLAKLLRAEPKIAKNPRFAELRRRLAQAG